MTTIRYSDSGDVLYFSAIGHAEYAKPGTPDIVCASVSSFVSLLANLVAEAHAENKIVKPLTIQIEPGNVQIICTPKRKYYDMICGQFKVVMTGLEMLAEQYTDHVCIKRERREQSR